MVIVTPLITVIWKSTISADYFAEKKKKDTDRNNGAHNLLMQVLQLISKYVLVFCVKLTGCLLNPLSTKLINTNYYVVLNIYLSCAFAIYLISGCSNISFLFKMSKCVLELEH